MNALHTNMNTGEVIRGVQIPMGMRPARPASTMLRSTEAHTRATSAMRATSEPAAVRPAGTPLHLPGATRVASPSLVTEQIFYQVCITSDELFITHDELYYIASIIYVNTGMILTHTNIGDNSRDQAEVSSGGGKNQQVALFFNPLFDDNLPGQVPENVISLPIALKTNPEGTILAALDMVGASLIEGYKKGFVTVTISPDITLQDTVRCEIYPFIKFMLNNNLVLMQHELKKDKIFIEHVEQLYEICIEESFRNTLKQHKTTYNDYKSVNPFDYYTQLMSMSNETEKYDNHFRTTGLSLDSSEITTAIGKAFTEFEALKTLQGFCTYQVYEGLKRLESELDMVTHEAIERALNMSFLKLFHNCDKLINICSYLIELCFYNLYIVEDREDKYHKKYYENALRHFESDFESDFKRNLRDTSQFLLQFNNKCEVVNNVITELNIQYYFKSVLIHDIIFMFITSKLDNIDIESVLTMNAIIEYMIPDSTEYYSYPTEIRNLRKRFIYTIAHNFQDLFKSSMITNLNKESEFTHIKTLIDFLNSHDLLQNVEMLQTILTTVLTTTKQTKQLPLMPLLQAYFTRRNRLKSILKEIVNVPKHISEVELGKTFTVRQDEIVNFRPYFQSRSHQYKCDFVSEFEPKPFFTMFLNILKKSFGHKKRKPVSSKALENMNGLIKFVNKILFVEYPLFDTSIDMKEITNDERERILIQMETVVKQLDRAFEEILKPIDEFLTLYNEPLTVEELDKDAVEFYKVFLTITTGGTPPIANKMYILGRSRKIVKKGRSQYVTYKKELIKLSDARKIEQQLAKEENKRLKLKEKQKLKEVKSIGKLKETKGESKPGGQRTKSKEHKNQKVKLEVVKTKGQDKKTPRKEKMMEKASTNKKVAKSGASSKQKKKDKKETELKVKDDIKKSKPIRK